MGDAIVSESPWLEIMKSGSIMKFQGPAKVFEREEDAFTAVKAGKIKAGAVSFSVNVEGVKSLILKTSDAGDGTRSDWALWLEPVLNR